MPRRTKLTSQRMLVIQKALVAGGTRKAAAAVAGVGESTLHDWLRAGRSDDGAAMQQRLLVVVEAAEASAELRAAGAIDDAIGGGDWKAAAWWLERRRRRDWGKGQPVPVAVADAQQAPSCWTDLVLLAAEADA